MTKIIANIADNIANRVTFELDGVEQQATFTVSIKGQSIRIIVLLDNAVTGTISNVKVYDAENVLSCQSDKSFVNPAGKKIYFAFGFTITERVI